MAYKSFFKTRIAWILLVLGFLFIAGYVVYLCYDETQKTLGDIIGISGLIISYLGVGVAVYQIHQANEQIKIVSNVTKATETAVKKNSKEILKFQSSVNTSALIGKIRDTQMFLSNNEFATTYILIEDIRQMLNHLHRTCSDKIKEDEELLKDTIKKLGTDSVSLLEAIESKRHRKPVSLKLTLIQKHLEIVSNIILKVEAIQTKEIYDT